MQRKAIVTIVCGERYQQLWKRFSFPGWQKYAVRHGYELVVLEQPLDLTARGENRSIAWQKLLVAGNPHVAKFDVMVWLDADIVVNHWLAPCIASSLTSDRVGIAEETRLPGDLFSEMTKENDRFWTSTLARVGVPHPLDPYRRYGFAEPAACYFNSGVMVIRPALHRELLEHVYNAYEDKGPLLNYEQIPLSYELATSGRYELIDPKYNVLWLQLLISFGYPHRLQSPSMLSGRAAFLARLLSRVYFLHFAGAQHIMPDVALLDIDREPVALKLDVAHATLAKEMAEAARVMS